MLKNNNLLSREDFSPRFAFRLIISLLAFLHFFCYLFICFIVVIIIIIIIIIILFYFFAAIVVSVMRVTLLSTIKLAVLMLMNVLITMGTALKSVST